MLVVLPDNLSSVPIIHDGQLTIVCHSRCWGSIILPWNVYTCGVHSCTYIRMVINTKIKVSYQIPARSFVLIDTYSECSIKNSRKTPNPWGKERAEGKKKDERRTDERKPAVEAGEIFQLFGSLTWEFDVDKKMR